MTAKLKQDTLITATNKDGYFWKIDDTSIFTETPASKIQIYDNEGKKLYFLEKHDLSGCGFPEDMFDIV